MWPARDSASGCFYRKSGMGRSDFCRSHGMALSTLARHQKKQSGEQWVSGKLNTVIYGLSDKLTRKPLASELLSRPAILNSPKVSPVVTQDAIRSYAGPNSMSFIFRNVSL